MFCVFFLSCTLFIDACFFLLRRKKKDGHFRGRQWSLKKLVLSGCVHTNTQKTWLLWLWERERRGGIHIPNSISLSPFKHITFAPDSPEKTLCMGVCFSWHFTLYLLYNCLHDFVFFSFLKHLSPLRKFLFFDLHSCSSGWHFYYYTHIYIIIHI